MRRFKPSYFFLVLGIILSIYALVFWAIRSRQLQDEGDSPMAMVEEIADSQAEALPKADDEPLSSGVADEDLGVTAEFKSPESLVAGLAAALENDDMQGFADLLGGSVDEASLNRLREFAARQRDLGYAVRVREVGEQELNKRARWALEYGKEGERKSLYLDLKLDDDKWLVEKITLPSDSGDDSLAVAENFLQAVLSQQFERARGYVEAGKVSDTRIAGLCILFEEGKYRMRENKPLRAMFHRKGVAGYLANVVAADSEVTAQFALTLVQPAGSKKWLVSEVNLDRLLADYSKRVAGGDIYYSPLVRNPAGGDTLALYFEFDEDSINPRTRKQLEIVSEILKSDPLKKLTLSGHTDSMGTDDYNRGLSMRRAEVVRDFLIGSGVHAQQVVTEAMGASLPRRPNRTESGGDNPEGRRANRRTEIYLDF